MNTDHGVAALALGIPGKRGPRTWTPPANAQIEIRDTTGEVIQKGRLKSIRVEPTTGPPPEAEPHSTVEATATLPDRPHVTSAFLSKVLLAVACWHLGPDVALRPELDLHRANLRATRDRHLPRVRVASPDGPAVPAWWVDLLPEGLVVDLYGRTGNISAFRGLDSGGRGGA